jgi:hypothetical protein
MNVFAAGFGGLVGGLVAWSLRDLGRWLDDAMAKEQSRRDQEMAAAVVRAIERRWPDGRNSPPAARADL